MRSYDRFVEWFASSRFGSWMFMNVFTYLDRWLMPISGGRLSSGVGSRFHGHALVLETTGAKSGKVRRVPLISMREGENVIVVASATGQAKNPAWYYNLKTNPEATVHFKGQQIPVTAREAVGGERDALYARAIDFYSGLSVYRERTSRTFPVIVLTPRQ